MRYKMKKVMFFNNSFYGGGVEKVLLDIVKHIDRTKYDITVITEFNNGPYYEEMHKECRCINTFPYIRLTQGKNIFHKAFNVAFLKSTEWLWRHCPRLYYILAIREKFDIEVAFMHNEVSIIIAASNNKKSKKIAWVHTDLRIHPGWTAYFKNIQHRRKVYNRFDKIVGVSDTVCDSVSEVIGYREKLMTIYNFIDVHAVETKAKEPVEISFKNNYPLVVSVGRLRPEKDYSYLLEVHKRIIDSGIKHNLLIVGGGTEQQKLEKLIIDLNISDTAKLAGYQDNPYKYIAKADLTVCSSKYEGLHLASAESIILGKPVVSRVPVVKELFGGYDCGIVAKNDNDFENAISRMLTDNDLFDHAKAETLKRAEAFKRMNMISEVENLFDTI